MKLHQSRQCNEEWKRNDIDRIKGLQGHLRNTYVTYESWKKYSCFVLRTVRHKTKDTWFLNDLRCKTLSILAILANNGPLCSFQRLSLQIQQQQVKLQICVKCWTDLCINKHPLFIVLYNSVPVKILVNQMI